MKHKYCSIMFKLLILQCLSLLCVSQDFDFFYFVQQWPASYCDTKQSCCYPTSGKPAADFSIHGLWPNYKDGSYPSNCDADSPFNQAEACPSSNSVGFWTHEWVKHGTCSESVLDQHGYFASALNLKQRSSLLQSLNRAGIEADGKSYSLQNIKEALKEAIGYTPWIECNTDASGNSQLYQIYLCVDTSGSDFIECPVFPKGKCSSAIEFPSF